jgi:tungstate transport system ATP-binding protein
MLPNPAIYRFESVRHRYGDREVLHIDALEVMRGETLALIGPSGAGKSTLLRLLQFLEPPTEGRTLFDGRPIDADLALQTKRRVTTVFQRPLMLDRSVRDNVAFGLRVRGTPIRPKDIDRLLESVGLAPLAGVRARTLSGGEIQRVAIVRALAFGPEVLLLDEPTANLDPGNVRLVEDMIRNCQARGVTIVLAVHQIFQARRLASRTALLLDGRLIEIGPTAKILDDPQDPRTRAFLTGSMVY